MTDLTLHDVAVSTRPIGIECQHCMRHALLTREIAGVKAGDTRTLREAGLHCGKCGSRDFEVATFDKRSRMVAFMRNP